MKKVEFPKQFLWGAATSAYQIEGAPCEGGKGESIWDRFTKIPGKVCGGDSGDVACDHFHRLKQDVELMKTLGLKSYRFSISWARIFPNGTGEPNLEGIRFYRELVGLLKQADIVPTATLYHWDLPQKLQDMGGWANRKTADYFANYAAYLFEALGNDVPIWITHNEPWVAAFEGNWYGTHAPGLTDYKTALQVAHNILLSHGKAVRGYRRMGLTGKIGITLNMATFYPATESEADKTATAIQDGFQNRWFADAVMKGAYPSDMWQYYGAQGLLPEISASDMELIGTPTDFLGINYYMSEAVAADAVRWPLQVKTVSTGRSKTEMGWEIRPEGLYDLLVRLHTQYGGIALMITENGAACNDIVGLNGEVEDPTRIDYLKRHFIEIARAMESGVNFCGYYVWSLFDNFEWAFGYAKRFGIVYNDPNAQQRIIKQSGYWYKEVIAENGFMP